MSPGPRLDCFARRSHAGFVSWGAEWSDLPALEGGDTVAEVAEVNQLTEGESHGEGKDEGQQGAATRPVHAE